MSGVGSNSSYATDPTYLHEARIDEFSVAENLARTYQQLELFVEFLSQGKEKPIVPYVTEGMGITELERVMHARCRLFEAGFQPVMRTLARKVKVYLGKLETMPSDTLRKHHEWLRSQRHEVKRLKTSVPIS